MELCVYFYEMTTKRKKTSNQLHTWKRSKEGRNTKNMQEREIADTTFLIGEMKTECNISLLASENMKTLSNEDDRLPWGWYINGTPNNV